eukprot:2411380-Pleurochrysis_carterae.AAC.1
MHCSDARAGAASAGSVRPAGLLLHPREGDATRPARASLASPCRLCGRGCLSAVEAITQYYARCGARRASLKRMQS